MLDLTIRGRTAILVACLASLWEVDAHSNTASHELVLLVTRAPDSAMCPEASDIFAAVAQLFPNRALMPAPADKRGVVRINVSIRRTASGHEATAIVSGQYRAERRIVDPDWECRGLRDALAVSLLLAVETESTVESHTPPAHPQPDRLSAPVIVGQRRAAVSVEAGGMGAAGLLGHPALGGFIGSSLGLDNGLALSARGIRLVAQPTQQAGSDIQVDLWGVMAGPCWWAVMSSDWLVCPCLELGWGEQRGRASGIFRDASARRRWLVLGPSLSVAYSLWAPLEALVSAGVTVRLHNQSFEVAEPDLTQRQEAVGAYLAAGMVLRLPLLGQRAGQ